jgi:hypothetical protein
MKKIYKVNIILVSQIIFFSIALFSMVFNFPFKSMTVFVVPCMIVYLLLSFNRYNFFQKLNCEYILSISIYYIYIAFILLVSAAALIESSRITRFFLILVVLPFFFIIDHNKDYDYFYRIFIFFSSIKSIIQIVMFLAIVFFNIPIIVLQELFDLKHGQIYSDGLFLHIILGGSSLLLLAFMLRFIRTCKLDIINLLLLFGVMISGNFAYLLGLFCFLFYYCFMIFLPRKKQWYIYIALFFSLILLLVVISSPYIISQVRIKSGYSNATRIDQAKILLTAGNIFIGNGLGKSIDVVTQFRNYTGTLYFELQTLYIINQIGLIGYILFMICTIYIFIKHNNKMLPIYLLYLIYSFWNPNCFDSGHMITALLLVGNRKFGTLAYNKIRT